MTGDTNEDTEETECERCGGEGVVLVTYRKSMLFGLLPAGEESKVETCPDCGGTGTDS